MTYTTARPDQAPGETIDRPRRRTRVAVDVAGLAYVIAVYVAVLTRGRFYVQQFHELDRARRHGVLTGVLHLALSRGPSFMFALVGDVPIDIAAAILVTGVMVWRSRRVGE
jgi:hypothetical protein